LLGLLLVRTRLFGRVRSLHCLELLAWVSNVLVQELWLASNRWTMVRVTGLLVLFVNRFEGTTFG